VDVEQPVGAPLGRDIARGARSDGAAEREINRFIEHRSMKLRLENQERAEEAAFAESTRRANERHREQIRAEWHLHHQDQAERLRNTLEQLIEHHEERAQELAELGSGGDAA
jgi:hypothetical protein